MWFRFVGCLEGGVGPDCAGPGIVTTSGPGPGLPPVTDKLCSGTNCISGPGPCQDGRCQDNKTPPSPPVSSKCNNDGKRLLSWVIRKLNH